MTLRFTTSLNLKARALALVGLFLAGLPVLSQSVSAAPSFDPALVNDEFVVGGMSQAVAADWLPDGRMIVLTKPGLVYLVNAAAETKSLIYTMPDVDSRGESGALDVVIDLSFSTTNTFYVYYSAMADSKLKIAKLVVDPPITTVVTNTTLWSNPGPLRTVYADPTNHIGGSLDIGPDGKFYLTIGDALASISQDRFQSTTRSLPVRPSARSGPTVCATRTEVSSNVPEHLRHHRARRRRHCGLATLAAMWLKQRMRK
jgi:glucose/arabinose dehydrogenase